MKGKIFNAQEMQAIISGNKRMFREVIKFSNSKTTRDFQEIALKKILEGFSEYDVCLSHFFKVPYQVGQKIFCKESFSSYYEDDAFVRGDIFLYRADEDSKDLEDVHWKPAQHMKQEHSRITLQIKEIRVERLADISKEDAINEGMKKTGCFYLEGLFFGAHKWVATEISDFKENWNATHKKPEENFEANPWVFVYSFGITT